MSCSANPLITHVDCGAKPLAATRSIGAAAASSAIIVTAATEVAARAAPKDKRDQNDKHPQAELGFGEKPVEEFHGRVPLRFASQDARA